MGVPLPPKMRTAKKKGTRVRSVLNSHRGCYDHDHRTRYYTYQWFSRFLGPIQYQVPGTVVPSFHVWAFLYHWYHWPHDENENCQEKRHKGEDPYWTPIGLLWSWYLPVKQYHGTMVPDTIVLCSYDMGNMGTPVPWSSKKGSTEEVEICTR